MKLSSLLIVLALFSCASQRETPQQEPEKPPVEEPKMNCWELTRCVAMYCIDDEWCMKQCAQESTKQALDKFIDVIRCMQANHCSDTECALGNCGSQISRCADDHTPNCGENSCPIQTQPSNY